MGRKYTIRRKAPFGTQETATLAAAGITAAASMAAAGMAAKAQKEAAKEQADSISRAARQQSESMKQQNENSKALQKEQIEAQQQMVAEQNEIQKGIQMDLQMLAGKQTQNERLDAAKIQVRNGGSLMQKSLTQGRFMGGNTPFTVTDGGGVIPLNIDKNGYGLYEIYGNDHNHYHDTKSGKRKTGVGFKFPNGTVIEGEGNQNTSRGEKLYVTPQNAMFISKHNLNGFNPANAVDRGMHPQQAFDIQEAIKARKGITDSGKKAESGAAVRHPFGSYNGAMITTAGNVGSALISRLGNHYAANMLTKANTNAANLIADAASQWTGIDLSDISRDKYNAAHAMAVVRAPIVNTETERTAIARSRDRMLDTINNNSVSSAAALSRKSTNETKAIDAINEVENGANKIREQIKQGNAERLTQVANENANRDTQAFKDYIHDLIQGKIYNSEVHNSKLSTMAQAFADAGTQNAAVKSQLLNDTATKFGNALTSSAESFANTVTQIEKNRNDFYNTISGVDTEKQVNSLILRGDEDGAWNMRNALTKIDTPDAKKYVSMIDESFGFNKQKEVKNPKINLRIPKFKINNYYDDNTMYRTMTA